MIGKADRQRAILRLVKRGPIGTQGELIAKLRAGRIEVEQSTLSRDLTELGIRKVGGRYVPSDNGQADAAKIDYAALVQSFTACGPNLIVITTDVGQASPVAVMMDEADEAALAGTLAGDDAIFVATRTRRTQTVALRRLKQWFGEDKYVQ